MAVFGNEVAYGTYNGLGDPGLEGARFQLVEAGNVTNISTDLISWDEANHNCKCGIYSDKAGPLPDAFLGGSANVVVNAGGWYNFAVDIDLAAGWYWLAIFLSNAACRIGNNRGAGGVDKYNYPAYNGFPNPFGAPSDSDTALLSIHADYTPAAAGMTVPVAFHHLKSVANAHVTDFARNLNNVIPKARYGCYR